MGAAPDGGVVWRGCELVKHSDLDEPSGCVPSKLLDGGAESSTCGICSVIVQTRGLLDCCNHLFCFSCITEWFTVSNLCPLCKSRSRFITPQMLCVDTGHWMRLEDGSGSLNRDGGPSDEDYQPVSFPPYFIDEEAVLCLEGDSCLVRAGLLLLDAEGNASSDTSVACDLCDCWYHGGCVSFQPDQTSFICPRCLASKERDAPHSSTVASLEQKASSVTISLPPKDLSAYESQTMLGIASVALEDTEEGESHVSISLRRISDVQSQAQPTVEESGNEVMWSPIREPFVVQTHASAWAPLPQRSGGPESNEGLLSSTRDPTRKVPYFEEELWSPTREPAVEVKKFQDELWSPTQNTVKVMSSLGTRSEFTVGNSFGATNLQRTECRDVQNPGGPHAVVPQLSSSAKIESCSTVVSKALTSDEVSPGISQLITTEAVVDPMRLIKEEISIDVDRLQVAVEQLRKGKRKVLQEDERNIDVKDLPEMPRKIARKSVRKVGALDEKGPIVCKDLVKKATTDQVTGKQTAVTSVNSLESGIKVEDLDDTSLTAGEEEKIRTLDVVTGEQMNTPHPKSSGDAAVKIEPIDASSKEQCGNPQSEDHSAPDNVEISSLEIRSEVDVMDIVKDARGCLVKDVNSAACPSKGVRTRVIMHREPDMKDNTGSSLVERIRQQMRDTAGYGAGDDLGKVEVSDDRFIAAFMAAQTRSYEKSKDVRLLSSRQESSGRLWKVLDKRYSATGARDNLIRKLYAGGGRKCWDRDWDIAFWRERDPHQRRSRKESEGEIDGSRRKDSGVTDMQPDSEDAEFFNRLYVADTSLFPRNEDVKPLSVQGNHAEETRVTEPERNRTGKVPQPHLDKVSPTLGIKDNAQQHLIVQGASSTKSSADKLQKSVDVPSQIMKKSLKPNAMSRATSGSASPGKARGISSTALQGQGKYTEATSSDVKKDKRQWALEVLARKEGTLPSSSRKTGGGSITKDNLFPLLLQLPVEMRPLILGDSRRNKIPPAVRQVQLNRLVEQELKRANLAVVGKGSECDAIARAVAREDELCKSSNSKGVYLNRCVRALVSTEYEVKIVENSPAEDQEDSGARPEESSRPEDEEAVRKALEDTGLMYSPIGDPVNEQEGQRMEESQDPKCKVSETKGVSGPTRPVENQWVENVLEVENPDLDIYGDFEFTSDDELGGALLKDNSERLKDTSAASCYSLGGKVRTGSLMVVLTSGSCQSEAALYSGEEQDPTKASGEGHGGASSCNGGGSLGTRDSLVTEAEASGPPVQASFEDADDMYDGLELNLNPVLSSEVMAQLNAEPYASSPKLESRGNQEYLRTLPVLDVDLKERKGNESVPKGYAAASENTSEDDCMKFADIDRRIENIRRSKALNGDSHRSKKSKGRNEDGNRTSGTNVQKQVEIYVNQHLKPLYRSQVITAEQFKWTVSKTAAKVMEHHGNAVNADFLITEGSKVKKLADQYLQAFAHRKA